MLDSLALDASIYILFDNIRGKIVGEDIEAFITSQTWDGRLLGESARFRVDNVATVFFTGNESTTSGDIAERCLFCELFIHEADNRDRVIPRVIDDSFLAEPARRSQILSALWALVRAWEADGKPMPEKLMPRFEEWSKIVPGIVIAAKYADPLAAPELPTDIEIADMRALVKILAPEPPVEGEERQMRRVWRFDEIIDEIREHGLFEDVEIWQGRQQRDLFDSDGKITSAGKSFFGKLLTRYNERLFKTDEDSRLRFRVEGKGNSRKYIIVVE